MLKLYSYSKASSRLFLSTVAATGLIAASNSAHAELLAYEGFDYDPVSVMRIHNGLNGGTGWGGGWGNLGGAISNNVPIISGSFGYTDTFGNILVTSGNRVFVTGNGPANGLAGGTLGSASPNRTLTLGQGTNGLPSVTWVSFLSQVVGPAFPYADPAGGTVNYGRAQGMNLMFGGNERMLLGRSSQNGEPADPTWPNDTWALNIRGNATFSTNASITSDSLTELTLVLVGIFHDGNPGNFNDIAYMWLNPSDLANPTNSAPVATISADTFTGADRDLNFDRIRLFAGSSNSIVGWGNIEFDEIRIGTGSPTDVLPFIPEPAVASLLGLAGLGVVLHMRRRRH